VDREGSVDDRKDESSLPGIFLLVDVDVDGGEVGGVSAKPKAKPVALAPIVESAQS
jgi:hypothetical protein